jgi:hypothetical protein
VIAVGALDVARRVKHTGWLAGRKAVESVRSTRDRAYRAIDARRPPVWSRGDYGGTFLDRDVVTPVLETRELPRRVFVLWTGDNDLTPNRRAALDELRSRQSVDVVLVMPDNLSDWWVDAHPPHPAYDDLSLVHRSDYLRSYLLHHHGGAYCDLKRGYGSLADCIERLERSGVHWLMGYPELSSHHVAAVDGELGRALRRHHGVLVGNGAFVARPRTQLTAEWLSEVERRLDGYATELASHPGNTWGDNPGYPVPWGSLLGGVLQPLTLKHREHVISDPRLLPSLTDFR